MKSRRRGKRPKFFTPGLLLVLVLAIGTITSIFWLQLRGPLLSPVTAKYVCMVDDKVYDKAFTPVSIQGRTFYACSQHSQLLQNADYRTAVDPYTLRKIDKSQSFILKERGTKKAYYFENYNNLKDYMHLHIYGRTDPHRQKP